MIPTILLAAVCTLPQELVVRDECDLVEVNRYHDNDGKLIFRQVVYWDANYEAVRYDVVAWHMARGRRPTLCRGKWVVTFVDSSCRLRRVLADRYVETVTTYDPEREHIKILPAHKRRGLSRPARGR